MYHFSKNSNKDDILQYITRLVTIENLLLNVDGVKNIYDDIEFLKKEINYLKCINLSSAFFKIVEDIINFRKKKLNLLPASNI